MSGHGHSHGHDHGASTATGKHRWRLVLVVGITAAVFVAEVIGGLASGSLALLADAGHMLTDATGLVIALIATSLAARPATSSRTFGWQRAEILAALVNGMLLTGIAVWVLVEAVRRWNQPADISSTLMLLVAIGGAVANVVGLLILRGRQGREPEPSRRLPRGAGRPARLDRGHRGRRGDRADRLHPRRLARLDR